ncbi:MAG: type II toxin-antitoxin system Phd/YefM family antitoxin [Desulfococcaceae bacterium]
MKSYTYSEARQKLSEILDLARSEEVIIKRRRGESFIIKYKYLPKSPFDVAGIRTKATTGDILDAVRESRSGESEHSFGAD